MLCGEGAEGEERWEPRDPQGALQEPVRGDAGAPAVEKVEQETGIRLGKGLEVLLKDSVGRAQRKGSIGVNPGFSWELSG